MKKSIQKPINWQDFEDLCKRLWGEIWKCPEIVKHGRNGQAQQGVDVSGIPKGETGYYGIQCKGKDDYAETELTEKEIDIEIAKAKKFQPPLKKFYFATTANKYSKIEAYVRKKNIENIKAGLFEVHLFSWEDIADLIDENPDTYNFYVNRINFKKEFDFEVIFDNGEKEIIVAPKFKRHTTEYRIKRVMSSAFDNPLFQGVSQLKNRFDMMHPMLETFNNANYSWTDKVSISFRNSGSVVIEDYKLYLYPEEGKIRDISGFRGGLSERISFLKYSSLRIFDDELQAAFIPMDNQPLIQKAAKGFDLYFLCNQGDYDFKIEYQLLARDYNTEGELLIKVRPEWKESTTIIEVDSEDEILPTVINTEDVMGPGSFL